MGKARTVMEAGLVLNTHGFVDHLLHGHNDNSLGHWPYSLGHWFGLEHAWLLLGEVDLRAGRAENKEPLILSVDHLLQLHGQSVNWKLAWSLWP